ncbi:SET domain-containing protein [Phlebopus sp. FC_14]|nr:SET domain-containing protein [Phlebopus sp. FC_14]
MEDSPIHQLDSAAELVQSVLSSVHAEFTSWNNAYCERALSTLASPSPKTQGSYRFLPDTSSKVCIPDPSSSKIVDDTPVPTCSLRALRTSYSQDGCRLETPIYLDTYDISTPLSPHPPYEFCAPVARNLFKGDDDDNMPFIPYADDPSFDQVDHTRCYDSFSWQNDVDPDWEVIVLEAAYRLHAQHHLSYREIDECGVFPLKLYSSPGRPGLFSVSRRRDRLDWGGSSIPPSYSFLSTPPPPRSNLRRRLGGMNALLCPNISCVEPLCSVHVEVNTMPPPKEATLSLAEINSRVKERCGNECFLDVEVGQNPLLHMPISAWTPDDIDSLKVMVEIAPELTTCELAELCFKPCREVMHYRSQLSPDSDGHVRQNQQTEDTRDRQRVPELRVAHSASAPISIGPCEHSGPCDISANCPCFNSQAHCDRRCRCPGTCNRRWRGCRCSSSGSNHNKTRSKFRTKVTVTTAAATNILCASAKKCACFEAGRECDPELCTGCRCRDPDTTCRNSQIWRGERKELETRRSSWGLGAFLLEPAKTGDLIIEYIGELIYEPTFDSRGELADHRGRSYVFGLNDTLSLDSSFLGNQARFIDHPSSSSSGRAPVVGASGDGVRERGQKQGARTREKNCLACIRLVNGEHRIGIYASRDIEAGAEVLIDYGSSFFTRQMFQ